MFESKKESFTDREERILEFWRKERIFEKSLEKKGPLFAFYDGPPFATGLPHYGHLLAGTIKDVLPRYKTMNGFHVPRRFGWDCHGLPVENEIEKAKEMCGEEYIKCFGLASFNEECSKIVLRYTEEWKKTVERMGRWVDFKHTYRTMDLSFMESVWWIFKQLYDKGLVYEGFKVMPFSTKLGTPLSNFEANLNYKDVDDPSLTLIFKLLDEDVNLLAWTTTPWTLVSNLALAVGGNIDYVKVKDEKGKVYILAKERLKGYFKECEVLETFKGEKLRGKRYRPLFSYFADRDAFRVVVDDFVSLEEGTGIVHMAPAFGEVDFYVCKKEGIELVCPVDHGGKFTDEIREYKGEYVKDADKKIIKRLKEEGKVFRHEQIRHRYPFCWRSDTPLIYKAVTTWFVAVEKIKDRLVEANKKIYWMPAHIKEGRFGKWLESARDWAISRNRFWGTPIPIWRSEEGDIEVCGSIAELESKSKKKVGNLHRQFIDDIVFEKGGRKYKRIEEVFDCWFESGSMPYAQNHYPFENEKDTMKAFPADFIAEGLDQTRGWFYTLNVLSVALFDKPAFKNVIVNGIILAEDGTKMSKRLKNYPEPEIVLEKYGADAIRLYMLNSPAVRAEDLCFCERGVELVLRQVLLPLWNSYHFFSTYAIIYKWQPTLIKAPKAYIDRWILSLLNRLIEEVREAMDRFDLEKATEPFISFVDQLTNWYIRRSRSRFWADEDTQGRREAFATLYTVLLELSKIIAPFVPFISEAMYKELKADGLSVHLESFPVADEKMRDRALEKEMDLVQRTVSIGHALRKEHKIKVRQPLAKATIVASGDILDHLKRQGELICDELNVKSIEFCEDELKFVYLSAKPNFPVLGKKLGKNLPKAKETIQNFDQEKLKELLSTKKIKIEIEGRVIEILGEEVVVERKIREGIVAAGEGGIVIAFDTQITDELLLEGFAREIVNKINTMRKEEGFEVTDRINISMEASDIVKRAFNSFKDYISSEVLALSVKFEKCDGKEVDLNGEKTLIKISKVF